MRLINMIFIEGAEHLRNKYLKTYSGLSKELYFIFLARVVNCMGSFILPLLTLILTQKLGMSKSQTGSFSAFLMLTQGPCLILGGKLIDAVGRKKLLIVCEILGAVSYLFCSVIRSHALVAVFIVIAADLYIMASPAFDAMVADITKPEDRKASFSLIYLGINIGMTISPLIGGLLFKNYLQILFILDAVTTLGSAALIGVFVGETKNRQACPASANTLKAPSEKTPVFKVLKGVPILFIFLGLILIFHFSYSQWSFLLPLQFADRYGENGARLYSMMSTLNALVVITFTPILTHLTRRFRPLTIISCGGILYSLAFSLFSWAKSLLFFILGVTIFTFGEIIVTINLGTFIADHSPEAHRGRINAIFLFAHGTANAMGPLVMGRVISYTNYFISWTSVTAFALIGAASMFLLSKRERFLTLTS